ncbi:helix-turn-helix domain-containing protein [Xenorhabdus bovienii]|uniref:helix-turn-helix domain-containing protein n=1 Tax=Xenorhabdus bovienii TaxID=40576 RepID=UPI002A72E2CE|nr:helix-turn-helix domain-containing protein [Xenorhabdus bovienii]MDE9463224.1 helix-turn-helix domain-containing protein [Xenorhabdus bovienii]MDE9484106.1 helix-turn-helix domain-containing protein [Xenorhabdus bovienii]MDE9552705.1 helix-turn-helix domain-containing protein [Xenorhabdus bovienii]MDE9557938.1 helix-turn-helix domain-containing protein [Xenorhabdus bovienii]
MDIHDELFLTEQAADFLKYSVRRVRKLIKNGELPARRRGARGEGAYEILRSSCVAYIHNLHKNVSVNADCHDKSKRSFTCRSNYDTGYGTVISLRRAESALDRALAPQIRN